MNCCGESLEYPLHAVGVHRVWLYGGQWESVSIYDCGIYKLGGEKMASYRPVREWASFT